MTTDRIEREIVINAPQDRVWAALTEAEHVAGWFGDAAEVDLRPGGKMVFGWKEFGDHHARVERVEPPGFFSYRWARPTSVEPAEGNSTLVEFTLVPEGAGTRLRVVETGFASLAGRTSRAGPPSSASFRNMRSGTPRDAAPPPA
jgi:uncharacterized protein YndB with AHSA1/START domain